FLWSCFCSSCRPHRSLHSFPTRRSSDLFASVAAIVCGMRRLAPAAPAGSWRARLRNAALVSPCALVGTAPLTAFHFHQVSLVGLDRKSTRLNSSHVSISYAVFCLKKKNL